MLYHYFKQYFRSVYICLWLEYLTMLMTKTKMTMIPVVFLVPDGAFNSLSLWTTGRFLSLHQHLITQYYTAAAAAAANKQNQNIYLTEVGKMKANGFKCNTTTLYRWVNTECLFCVWLRYEVHSRRTQTNQNDQVCVVSVECCGQWQSKETMWCLNCTTVTV